MLSTSFRLLAEALGFVAMSVGIGAPSQEQLDAMETLGFPDRFYHLVDAPHHPDEAGKPSE